MASSDTARVRDEHAPHPPERRPAAKAAGSWSGWLFLAPAVLIYTAFMVYPWLQTVWLSFFDWNGINVGTWTGLRNYHEVLTDPAMLGSIDHALGFIVFFSLIPIALGLATAAFLARAKTGNGGITRTLLFLPQILPGVAVGITWTWLYSKNGLVNEVLGWFGLGGATRDWLQDVSTAYYAVGLIGSWVSLGLCVLLFSAGITKIDGALYESATLDGAGAWRQFWAITYPGIRNELSVALSLTLISALTSFDVIFVATQGGPGTKTMVPAVLVYQLAFTDGRAGAACALAVALSLIVGLVVVLVSRLSRED